MRQRFCAGQWRESGVVWTQSRAFCPNTLSEFTLGATRTFAGQQESDFVLKAPLEKYKG